MNDYSCYADGMDFVKCAETCRKCTASLHYKKDQGILFCWACITDDENAQRGRELLIRIKLKEAGEKFNGGFTL